MQISKSLTHRKSSGLLFRTMFSRYNPPSGLESAATEGSRNLAWKAILLELWRLSDPGPLSIPKWIHDGSGKVLDISI